MKDRLWIYLPTIVFTAMSIKDLVDGFVNQVTGRPEQALRDGNAALIELGMAAAAFGLSYLFENINRRGR